MIILRIVTFFITIDKILIAQGLTNIDELKTLNYYEVSDKMEFVKPSKKILRHRTRSKKSKVEPITLYCYDKDNSCKNLAKKIARRNKWKPIYNYIMFSSEKLPDRKNILKFKVTPSITQFLDIEELQNLLGTNHHNIKLETSYIKASPKKTKSFLGEIKNFIEPELYKEVKKRLYNQSYLSVEKYIIPESLSRKTKRYTSYQGPNCFEAALSFQNPFFSKSYLYNIKDEQGHHKIMINNDELYKILTENFHEIDPQIGKIKYGDLIIFVDYSTSKNKHDMKYSWIKHAVTFLFNNYTFSKGSKSSNSPYTIKTLKEEWELWKKRYNKLRIQVFRKPFRNNSKFNNKKLIDWIY